jgi:phosphohistidine phosphatase
VSRILVLIRHAKAADGSPDIRRVLAPRGEREAPAIGSWLASHDIHVDHAIVSPSARTRQTWQLAASAMSEPAADIDIDDRIYDNNVRSLLSVVHEAPEEAQTLALVGHNPSMHELAVILDDGTGDAAARAALAEGFPTSAVAVYEVGEWADVVPRACRLVASAVCRD